MLDYCEFLLNLDDRRYRMIVLVNQLNLMDLGLIEKQKMLKLKEYLQESCSTLSQSIYEGKLNFEKVELYERTVL